MNIYIIQLRQSADRHRTEGRGLQGHLHHCSRSGVWVMKYRAFVAGLVPA